MFPTGGTVAPQDGGDAGTMNRQEGGGDDNQVPGLAGFGAQSPADVDADAAATNANTNEAPDTAEDQAMDVDEMKQSAEDDEDKDDGGEDDEDGKDDDGEDGKEADPNAPKKRGRKRSSTAGDTAVTKRRPILPGSKKRGIPKGSKITSNKKLDDWYFACKKFEEINKVRKLSQAEFLRSDESGELFTGKVSEQQSFGRYLNKYKSGELKPTAKKRHYPRKYEEIEERLIKYYDLRSSLYKRDKCGVSWTLFQTKCLEWAEETGHADFRVTPGWVRIIVVTIIALTFCCCLFRCPSPQQLTTALLVHSCFAGQRYLASIR